MATVQSGPSTFMEYGDVEGYTVTEDFTGFIDVANVDYNMCRQQTAADGWTTGALEAGSVVTLGPLSFTKASDVCSSDLFEQATVGGAEKVFFHMTAVLAGVCTALMSIEVINAIMVSYAVTIQSQVPMESISIDYEAIQTTSTVVDPKSGRPKANQVYGFDELKGTKM